MFSGLSIIKKMVLGYFIIIFVPVIALGLYYYKQLYENMVEDYASSKQQIIEQAHSSLQMELLQLESNYKMFQYNNNVVDLLSGAYPSEAEYFYNVRKYISPLVSYVLSGNSHIKDIHFFYDNENLFSAPATIVPLGDLPKDLQMEIDLLLPNEGKWITRLKDSKASSLVYYQKLYNEQFTEQIGVLAIQMNRNVMHGFVETLSNEGRSEVHLLSEDFATEPMDDNRELYKRISEKRSDYLFLANKRLIINQLLIDKLAIRIAVVSQVDDVFNNLAEKKVKLILMITSLLILLSCIYYLLVSSVTKRILKLAGHMRNVGTNNFRMIDHQHDKDEIGYLTSSYNLMLQRIDELVNKIQRSELLRKEAAYKVLQAQIKPHFLYNTLETIRMLAETNEDREVADITFSFGKLMRYSLSNENEETKLSDEIKIIGHYLKIHKMRLGKRLEYYFNVRANLKQIRCPRFILQPLVENCIIHGLSTAQKCFRIEINIREDERYIYIDISDNGVGISDEKLNSIKHVLNDTMKHSPIGEKSLGLYNVSERIKAFYGEDSRMEVASKENEGTTFKLYLNKKGMFGHVKTVGNR